MITFLNKGGLLISPLPKQEIQGGTGENKFNKRNRCPVNTLQLRRHFIWSSKGRRVMQGMCAAGV